MAGKDGEASSRAASTGLKVSSTAPNLQNLVLNPPKLEPATGWKGFMSRRGSDADCYQKNIHLDIPIVPTERKTSLTPEMDKIPIDFINRQSSAAEATSVLGKSPPRRGSLFAGMAGLGAARRGSLFESDEEDFRPPQDLPRRTSMTDAFQWLFKPMGTQPQSQSRNLNVLSPTST